MVLKALNCTRCGAPLNDPPQNELIRCGHCGQNHHFDPDPDPPPPPPPPVQVVMAPGITRLWMVPVALSVIGLLSTLVFLFSGPEQAPSAAASPGSGVSAGSDGPGDPAATYRGGEAVEVWWGSQWWKGTIKRVNDGGTYRIGYDGWSDSWDEDVTARRLRRR